MERNITSSPFRYWVTEVTDGPAADRNSVLMFGSSFNDDLENIAWDGPAGSLLAINPREKVVRSLHLSPAHVPRRGGVVGVEGWTGGLQPPFLLTDLIGAQIIADSEVEIEYSEWGRNIISRSYRPDVLPVETDTWFGLLFPGEKERAHLLAFSTIPGAQIHHQDRLVFTEWEEPCGELVL